MDHFGAGLARTLSPLATAFFEARTAPNPDFVLETRDWREAGTLYSELTGAPPTLGDRKKPRQSLLGVPLYTCLCVGVRVLISSDGETTEQANA